MINFIKKYWVWLLALIVFFPTGLKIYKEIKIAPKNKTVSAVDYFNKNGVAESKRGFLTKTSLELAHHLGTAYSVFSPKYWSENDKQIYELVKVLSQSDYNHVKKLYSSVYAKGRSLTIDLAGMLDDKYYKQLNLV